MVTHAQLDGVSKWGFRSPRLKNVLNKLLLYEGTASEVNRQLLRRAVGLWRVYDPKEFSNRNMKLKGMDKGICDQLAEDLAIDLTAVLADKTRVSAHELTLKTAGAAKARAVAKTKRLDCSVEDYMFELNKGNKSGSTAVLLIDMQAASVDNMQTKGACVKYNEDEVYVNQGSVLEAAAAYNMYVFEIRIVRIGGNAPTNIPTYKYLSDRLPAEGSDKLVRIDKPYFNSFEDTNLEEQLTGKNIETAVVMGHHANTCVLNTVFGTPASFRYEGPVKVDKAYTKGLLDREIKVVTSRVLLASENTKLDPEYNMLG